MILHLSCRDDGIGLNLPTMSTEAAERLTALREGLEWTEPIQISVATTKDGVRQTEFGLVRRLSRPFPPAPEMGPVMS